MSQQNVEIVRRGYEAFAEHGVPDLEFLDPEVEWRGPREFPDLAEPHFGMRAWRGISPK
jgi:ketosteroid isomerase-like protein